MGDTPAYPLNVFDPEVKADPYPHYAAMRAAGPVVRNPLLLGQWMVVGYDEVAGFLHDPGAFSSAQLTPAEGHADVFASVTMLDSDPPDHERLRSVVAKAFTPRSVATIEPRIREVARSRLEPLAAGGTLDIVSEVASPLPVLVIAEMLGVEPADRDEFVEWSHAIISTLNPFAMDSERVRAREGAAACRDYFGHQLAERRSHPADDLIGRMVAANADARLSDAEVVSSCVLLLLGGNETTTNLITNTVLALARHPDECQRVVADPRLVSGAIEESLRYDAPVQGNVRIATRPVVLGGEQVDQGALVIGLLAAANRDAAKFEQPDRFDVTRHPNPHLSFGHGVHFCLGASLARLEAQVAIGELLRVAPDYRLAEADARLDYGPVFSSIHPPGFSSRPTERSGARRHSSHGESVPMEYPIGSPPGP